MDPPPDPPLLAAQPPTAPPAIPTAAAANPTPTRAPSHNHPPYAEMITAAISELNERNGSSKRAVAKYIETHYSNLPPTHSALLTHYLKRLKINGQILMVKHSYKLPRSTPPPAVNGAVKPDPASTGSKRRPGRPPKPKPDAIQTPVPVFAPPMDMNALPNIAPAPQQPPHNSDVGQGPVYVPVVGPENGTAAVEPVFKRGRGRPPKQGGFKRGRGRPPKTGEPTGGVGGGGGVGRTGRGRPKKIATLVIRKTGRPRGRPPKPINVVGVAAAPAANVGVAMPVVGGGVAAPLVMGKRRGRPPRADGTAKKQRHLIAVQPKKPRKFSGRPLGRPRKNDAAVPARTPDSQLLVAYLDLKSKLEHLQSRVKQTVTSIVPSLNDEAAISALHELEFVAMNVNAAPPIVQNQQPQQEQLPPEAQS
ncbi:hypothetical protein ACP275_04G134100 [Erythranthe tilingii]